MLSASEGKLCGWPFGVDKKGGMGREEHEMSEAFYLPLFQTNNAKMPLVMLSRMCPTILWSSIGCFGSEFV